MIDLDQCDFFQLFGLLLAMSAIFFLIIILGGLIYSKIFDRWDV